MALLSAPLSCSFVMPPPLKSLSAPEVREKLMAAPPICMAPAAICITPERMAPVRRSAAALRISCAAFCSVEIWACISLLRISRAELRCCWASCCISAIRAYMSACTWSEDRSASAARTSPVGRACA